MLGLRFERLVVVKKYTGPQHTTRNYSLWECVCDCGNTIITNKKYLLNKDTKSCGCLRIEKSRQNGLARRTMIKHPLNSVWKGIRTRCLKTSNSDYPRYGGRGIKICDRWLVFENFLDDMGECPPGYELDRIDNDGDYEPGNCRWATHKRNCNNKISNKFITHNGVTKTLTEWAESASIPIHPCTLNGRIQSGWDMNDSLSKGVQSRGRKKTRHNSG